MMTRDDLSRAVITLLDAPEQAAESRYAWWPWDLRRACTAPAMRFARVGQAFHALRDYFRNGNVAVLSSGVPVTGPFF